MTGPRVVEQDNYEVALKLAQNKWSARDPETQARRCGAAYVSDGGETVVKLALFSRDCEVTHPAGEVFYEGRALRPSTWEQILILHYLNADGPFTDSEKLISYTDIPDGKFYESAYRKRTRNHLLAIFGREPELFERSALSIGAQRVEMGDLGFKVRALPNVWIHMVMWRADEEFPPEASILLEERIRGYLDVEDIAVLGGMTVDKVAKASRK